MFNNIHINLGSIYNLINNNIVIYIIVYKWRLQDLDTYKNLIINILLINYDVGYLNSTAPKLTN